MQSDKTTNFMLQMQNVIMRTDRDENIDDPAADRFRFQVFQSAQIGEYFEIWTGTTNEVGKESAHTHTHTHTHTHIFHVCKFKLHVHEILLPNRAVDGLAP